LRSDPGVVAHGVRPQEERDPGEHRHRRARRERDDRADERPAATPITTSPNAGPPRDVIW
jgi:hypothetical protein